MGHCNRTLCLAILCLLAAPADLPAMGFSCPQHPPLAEEVQAADCVFLCRLSNARRVPTADDDGAGSTDCEVLRVVKRHAFLDEKARFSIPRFVKVQGGVGDFLVFADVPPNGIIDVYRGIPCDKHGDQFADYLSQTARASQELPRERLRVHFRWLDHEIEDIRLDAWKNCAQIDASDILDAADAFDRMKVVAWLKDKKTPEYKLGLYALMLASHGRATDAGLLRHLLETRLAGAARVEEVMVAYCRLRPEFGLPYVLGVLIDPHRPFSQRHAALRAIGFLWADASEANREAFRKGLEQALQQTDFADLIVEDFRKGRYWKHTEQIIAMYHHRDAPPILKRSIMRYVLCCPEPQAKAFAEELRKREPERVGEAAELIRLEKPSR